MELNQMLKEHEEIKNTQLEEKEEEIKKLKNDLTTQVEERKKVDYELRKSLEDLKINVNLRTQLEEAKRVEELLKNQVNEKEESCHKLEDEVVDLKKKVEKSNTHIKFMNSSTILNEILDSQRSSNDKLGLGYKNEDTHLEASTSKKNEVCPSFSKGGNKVLSQVPIQRKENLKEQIKEDIKNTYLHPKANSEERHLQGGHQNKGMNLFFMVISSHVMNMVTNILIKEIMQGKMLEGFITP
jgi:chromosome segregation ATPase